MRYLRALFILIQIAAALSSAYALQEDVVEVTPYLSQDIVRPGDTVGLLLLLSIKPGYHINAHTPLEDFYIPTEVTVQNPDQTSIGAIHYPQAMRRAFLFSEKPLAVYEGEVGIAITLQFSESILPEGVTVSGKVSYQACTDQSCLAPAGAGFSLPIIIKEAGAEMRAINAALFERFAAGTGEAAGARTGSSEEVTFSADELRAKVIIERGLPYAVTAFFLLGLALNLTPCVYPVLPITVSYFGGRSSGGRGAVFLTALFYVLGIALVFSALGLISGLAGKQWGFLFQNPWFTAIIAILILSMAASMFGAFEIVLPSWLLTKLGTARQGTVGALIMGLTVGVVIAPCAAGIIIGLVGLVAKLGIVGKGALLFFVMGLGLGLPYLLLATFSSFLTRLPRSGMWMVWIRKLFGVLLVGVALYFILPQAESAYDRLGFFMGLLAMFGGLLLGFLDHNTGYTKTFNLLRRIFGMLVIMAGVFLFNNALQSRASAINWIEYRGQAISEVIAEGKPIFIDFYADWCAPCKQMDRTTFRDDEVTELAEEFTMVKVNCTSPTPAIQSFMNLFEVVGVPTFVFLEAGGEEREELREIGYINPRLFAEKMRRVKAGN